MKRLNINQVVVVRNYGKNFVGKVQAFQQIGKKFLYSVRGEDGKVYTDLPLDSSKYAIAADLTKKYCKANAIEFIEPVKETLADQIDASRLARQHAQKVEVEPETQTPQDPVLFDPEDSPVEY